jgi:hypothetical protein
MSSDEVTGNAEDMEYAALMILRADSTVDG